MKENYMKSTINSLHSKPVIMQHNTASFIDNGGPATGVKLLMESDLKSRYEFVPLIEKNGSSIFIIKDLIAQIKKTKPDLIHIRGLQSSGFYGLIAARLGGCKKVIVSVHGISIDSGIGQIKKVLYKKFIEPLTLKNADLVFCVCDYAAKRPYILRNTKNLYGFIHNAAPDYSECDREKLKTSLRKELGIFSDEVVVTSIGRIVVDKGMEYLGKSIKILDPQLNVRFLIVGEGDYLSELKIMLSEEIKSRRVMLLGKRPDVPKILFASDIFIFPTLRENLSNALLEASAAGLAIIATNVGGNPEVIQDNKNGILIPPYNEQELAKQITFLAFHPQIRQELGTNAEKNVRINFNQRLIFSELDKVYTQVLSF
jgi:glycosyltransferase involved in cell wall biosynthesis